ncbi:CRISPR-associated protein Cas4 [Acidilobus saccharovorans]
MIRPSDLHTFGYCPRLAFFELYMPRRRGLLEILRLFIGRAFHAMFMLRDKVKGYISEHDLVLSLNENVMIVGRADAIKVAEGKAHIIERKSSKAPRKGAWVSDIIQAGAYGLMVARNYRPQEITVEVRYPTASRVFKFDSRLSALVLKAIDDYLLVKKNGILPAAKRGRRCNSCPYREACFLLDLEGEEAKNLEEPGSWLIDIDTIEEQ